MYECSCGSCNHKKSTINLSVKNKFKKLLKTVEKAFKRLHKKGEYDFKELVEQKEYKQLISETSEVFEIGLEEIDLPEKIIESIKNDIYIFSGLKTHAQLTEASKLLFTKDNKIKSFQAFSKDIEKLKKQYNDQYLEAEYDFAVGSIQSIDRWENLSNDSKYYLQYRTANDDKVRDSHKALHNITLPKSDPFWSFYYTPNGWRCRCVVVEVLADLHKKSDSKKSLKKGEIATTSIDKNGKNKLEIFRFNPGLKNQVFPPKHPYHKVVKAKQVKAILKDEL